MTSLVFPLSRIEGHARAIIEIQNGRVLSAQFQAMEMRGFQQFVQGIPAKQITGDGEQMEPCSNMRHWADPGLYADCHPCTRTEGNARCYSNLNTELKLMVRI